MKGIIIAAALLISPLFVQAGPAWRDCIQGSYGAGGCESYGAGGGRSYGTDGGLSYGAGGGRSYGEGGGRSYGAGGGRSYGPGGGRSVLRDNTRGMNLCALNGDCN